MHNSLFTRLLAALSLLTATAMLLLSGGANAAGTNQTVRIVWDMPNNGNVDVYVLYATNALGSPVTNWPVLAAFYATNAVPYGSSWSYPVSIPQGQMFFSLAASNFWGTSFFSSVTNLPPVLSPLTNRLGVVYP